MKLILALLSTIFVCSGAHATPASEAAMATGHTLEASGNYKKAALQYRKALLAPDSIEIATQNLARVDIEINEYDDAINILSAYLAQNDPFNVDVHLLLSEAYFDKDMVNEALKEAQTCEILRPGLSRTTERIGAIYYKMKKYDKSIELLTSVLKTQTGSWVARFYRARSYSATGHWDLANVDFKSLVDQKPHNLEVQNYYAETFMKLEKWADAEKVLQFSLKVNPFDVPSLTKLAEVYAAMDRQDDVIATYKKLIEIDATNMEVSQKLVDAYISLKLYKNAEEELQREIKVSAGYEPAVRKLVFIYSEQKRFDLVGSFLKKYVEVWNDKAWVNSQYVQLLVRIGNIDYANAVQEKFEAQEKEPTADTALVAAFIRMKSGHADAAAKRLADAKERFPNDSRIKFNLGLAYDATKETDKAVAAYSQIPKGDPMFVKAHVNMAADLETDGKFAEAVAALKLIPGNSDQNGTIKAKIYELEHTSPRTPATAPKAKE